MPGKRLVILTVLLATTTVLAIKGFSFHTASKSEDHRWEAGDGRFVVHEWGTFTSFSGSDGVKLEFRPLLDADLPAFVLNRPSQAGYFNPFSKADFSVLQRMETPVTYFYSDCPRPVNVRVGFPQGLLTEFFPPVAAMQPKFTPGTEPVGGSELDWGRIWVIPENRFQADVEDGELRERIHEQMLKRLLPASDGHEHYAYARRTDSSLVYVERAADAKRPYAPHGGWFEKFLFYRGIGNFELPLQLTAHTGGRFELANVGEQSIRSLFLVTVEDQRVRFASFDEIGVGRRLTLSQSDRPSTVDELAATVQGSLVRAGLYDKEAAAMVDTWRSSWFGEQGTRLFYLLPEQLTDELLPLTIEPAPNERLRVMVGRLEIMSPEEESRMAEVVRQSARDRAAASSPEAKASYASGLPDTIAKLGRLAEPALVRVQHIAPDPAIRNEATLLLDRLRVQKPR